MPNVWTTLATRDLERTSAFYAALGFRVQAGPAGIPCLTVHPNEATTICLFESGAFDGMVPRGACDPSNTNELITSISLDGKAEVDAFAEKARAAGATLLGEPKDEPYGYGFGFTDPDGHVWAALWLA